MDIVLQDMKMISSEGNKRYVRANMLANNKNIALPTTGENIEGLSQNDILMPGSSIMTIQGDFIMMGIGNQWGEWI